MDAKNALDTVDEALRQPTFVLKRHAFMEKYKDEFDDVGEDRLLWAGIHARYVRMVRSHMDTALAHMNQACVDGFSAEVFDAVIREIQTSGAQSLSPEVLDALVSMTDFVAFRDMMGLAYKGQHAPAKLMVAKWRFTAAQIEAASHQAAFQQLVASSDDAWNFVGESSWYSMHMLQEQQECSIDFLRVIAYLDAPPCEVMALMAVPELHLEWDHLCESADILEKYSDGDQVIRTISKPPMPFLSRRETFTRQVVARDWPDAGSHTLIVVDSGDGRQSAPGTVLILSPFVSVAARPVDDRTMLTMHLQFDYGLPRFLNRLVLRNLAPRKLLKLSSAYKKLKDHPAMHAFCQAR
eukprot:TRINITY_DN73961_c0_g1_i1.p1 TRINITY_DN73961_c0_g1~~TRINITY_DN73961_c0_g1_i1.p1  ORF type:complete len:352 (-),score=67.19 TRINITY_DN73961_c0_g1_i1:490-1545(-)